MYLKEDKDNTIRKFNMIACVFSTPPRMAILLIKRTNGCGWRQSKSRKFEYNVQIELNYEANPQDYINYSKRPFVRAERSLVPGKWRPIRLLSAWAMLPHVLTCIHATMHESSKRKAEDELSYNRTTQPRRLY
jgi:hypothetical protein